MGELHRATELLEALEDIADEVLSDTDKEQSENRSKLKNHPKRSAMFQVLCDIKERTAPNVHNFTEEQDNGSLIRLDNMLIAEGVCGNSKNTQDETIHVDYKRRLIMIKESFEKDMESYQHNCGEFTTHVMTLLTEQRELRPITSEEIDKMVKIIQQKFQQIQYHIKQNTCENVMNLKSQLMDARRKRKNFSKHATDTLNEYFCRNIAHPYPSDEVKEQLALECNITVSQVSNWFGNRRIRFKKTASMRESHRSAPVPNVYGFPMIADPSSNFLNGYQYANPMTSSTSTDFPSSKSQYDAEVHEPGVPKFRKGSKRSRK